VAYKKDIDDVRESPALDIIHLLEQRGATVSYSDPYVPVVHFEVVDKKSVPDLEAACKEADCVVVVTNHASFDYAKVLEWSRLIVDTRNAMKGFRSEKIVRL
jgi:UDP-N-acetyl-D-glucosamine dehydrogenase